MPKKKRSFCRRKRNTSAPAVLLSSRRQSKRKQWADEEMAAAISAVKNGMTIKRPAKEHGVPPSTLRDRINGRVVHGTKPGPRPYLSLDEEKELGSFLKSCANLGYSKTRRAVMHIVQSAVAEKGLLKELSTGWCKRFLQC